MTARFGQTFEKLLEEFRKPDGDKWSSKELHEATVGFVNQSYISNLRAGRIRRPGYDRLKAIADVMGFPVSLWYENPEEWSRIIQDSATDKGTSIAQRLNLLFEVVPSELTGKPFTEKEVAQRSGGQLSEQQIGEMRREELTNPTISQLIALSGIFGVDISYWWLQPEEQTAITPENIKALKDLKSEQILNKVHDRSEAEKDMILTMIEQLDLIHNPRDDESESETR